MYNLNDYGDMIADDVRMQAYVNALTQTVTTDSIVVDIGTGTGIFALLACKLGARFVYAIETNDSIHVAKDIARANGFEEKIMFIKDLSTNVHLADADKADILISDLRGTLPLLEHHIDTIMDARTRLLKPTGILIPSKDTLWMAVVESPALYDNYTKTWEHNNYGIDMNIARNMSVNTWHYGRVDVDQVLTVPTKLDTLDYQSIQSTDITGNGNQQVLRDGIAHGIIIWFDTEIFGNNSFSNAPGANHAKVYGSAFFPLRHAVSVSKSDIININIKAVLVDDEYVWCWDTQFLDRQDKHIKAEYKQSTFYSSLISMTNLHKMDLSYSPSLNENGIIDSFILNAMEETHTVATISQKILKKFPAKFKDLREASTRVSKLIEYYSE